MKYIFEYTFLEENNYVQGVRPTFKFDKDDDVHKSIIIIFLNEKGQAICSNNPIERAGRAIISQTIVKVDFEIGDKFGLYSGRKRVADCEVVDAI